jgi:hypothetical protein
MPPEAQDRLDYESKLDRSPGNINWLLAQGEASAEASLKQRSTVVATH